MTKGALYLVIFSLCCGYVFAQPKIKTVFTVGIGAQAFTADRFLASPNNPSVSRNLGGDGGGNAVGLGLPLAIRFHSTAYNIGFIYEPVLRYDVVAPRSPYSMGGQPLTEEKLGFFADHHFSIFRKFRFTKKEKEKNKFIGAGYSFISPGISYKYDWMIVDHTRQKTYSGSEIDLSFEGYHVLYVMKVYKRFDVEGKLMYVPPYRILCNSYQSAIMFFLKATYQVPFKKK